MPQMKMETPNGDVKLFDDTLGFESYVPNISAPLLWLGSTNDFHGIMDDTYRTGGLIPHKNVRYSFTPHMNHRFTPQFAVTRPLWIDQCLNANFVFPTTPETRLVLGTDDHIPEFRVIPDSSQDVAEIHIYYSIDPDPRARFWRSVDAVKSGATWTAKLPILSVDQPLFAFANAAYPLKKSESEPYSPPTEQYILSSLLHTAVSADLKKAEVKATDTTDPVIDDWKHGWRDWYMLSADNPHHWEFSTRKLADPKWKGQPGQKLTLEVQAEKPNEMLIVLTENFFRPYRGKQNEFVAVVKLESGHETQTVRLEPTAFEAVDGEVLFSWKNIDLLSVRGYYEKGDKLIGSKNWAGRQPAIKKLSWSDSP